MIKSQYREKILFFLLSSVFQTAPPSPGLHSLWTEAPPAPTGTPSNTSQCFDLYDVKESSYHTFISRLDLHICNDSSSVDEGCLNITHCVFNVVNVLCFIVLYLMYILLHR